MTEPFFDNREKTFITEKVNMNDPKVIKEIKHLQEEQQKILDRKKITQQDLRLEITI